MKGFGVFEKGKVGWMEKPDYVCGPDDVICRPVALAPCSSDVHSAMEMEGDHLKNRILGHESIGQVIEALDGFHPVCQGASMWVLCME